MFPDTSHLPARATYFGIYWTCQSIFTAVLNLSSSYMAVNLAWQWYYRLVRELECDRWLTQC